MYGDKFGKGWAKIVDEIPINLLWAFVQAEHRKTHWDTGTLY